MEDENSLRNFQGINKTAGINLKLRISPDSWQDCIASFPLNIYKWPLNIQRLRKKTSNHDISSYDLALSLI